MRKHIIFFGILLLFCFACTGCSTDMFKSYNNIKNIEIYAGNAHSALERKVVTDRADIKYIINKIKKINVVRNAKSSDIIESGVGLQFKINSFDDETYSFVINDKLLLVGSKAYVISGSSFNYEFYKNLNYFAENLNRSRVQNGTGVKIDFYYNHDEAENQLSAKYKNLSNFYIKAEVLNQDRTVNNSDININVRRIKKNE